MWHGSGWWAEEKKTSRTPPRPAENLLMLPLPPGKISPVASPYNQIFITFPPPPLPPPT